MADPPSVLKAHRERLAFELGWADGVSVDIGFKPLRCECPCAQCVDEDTGIRILDVDSVPEDVTPTNLGFSGNYALKVTWSDGHSTGLYTWDHLRRLAESDAVPGGDAT